MLDNVKPHSVLENQTSLNRAEHLSNLRVSRTTRLPKTKPRNLKSKLANSRYE
ncbi:hypothetical protein RB2083_562 [Rhodobacteraceae bacterium HTCC2083]|nr:hypothetical protein RB2083_562 [Rhodobacteraceae bacterium HTCC2083]